MTVRETIAKNIRILRTSYGMSQEGLAERLKMRRPSISEIESTRRGVSVEECIEIAAVFGVDPERIYGSHESYCPACGAAGYMVPSPPSRTAAGVLGRDAWDRVDALTQRLLGYSLAELDLSLGDIRGRAGLPELCEGCDEDAVTSDSEGVPLCQGCADHLAADYAAAE